MSAPGNNAVNADNGNPRRPPNFDLQAFVKALMRQIQVEYALSYAAEISEELLRNVADIVRANLAPLAALLTTVGVGMLLPSLAVVIVNAIGFTSGGVLAGSIAAAIQSLVYGPLTGGVFSILQAFGATAAISPVGVLVVGGIALGTGAGLFGWWLYKKWQGRGGSGDNPPSQGLLEGPHKGSRGLDSEDNGKRK